MTHHQINRIVAATDGALSIENELSKRDRDSRRSKAIKKNRRHRQITLFNRVMRPLEKANA